MRSSVPQRAGSTPACWQLAIHGGSDSRSATTRRWYCCESAITSSRPVKSGGLDGLVNTIEGWTSSRIDDACIAAASANISCMNCGGALT